MRSRGLTDFVVSKLGFFPPRPPTYEYVIEDNVYHFADGWEPPAPVGQHLHMISTKAKQRIPVLHLLHPESVGVTILFSHGNAVDLGIIRDQLLFLCTELRVNVFSYDYSGFGQSSGVANESNLYADVEAAYGFLQGLGTPSSDIILYGQSIGSAPTTHLAARTVGLRGSVLHSALLSGMKVIFPEWKWYPVNVFPNMKNVQNMTCPVLVIHGLRDEIIDVSHGIELHRLLQLRSMSVMPLFIPDASHNDIECFAEYLSRMHEYLQFLNGLAKDGSLWWKERTQEAPTTACRAVASVPKEKSGICGLFSQLKLIKSQTLPKPGARRSSI